MGGWRLALVATPRASLFRVLPHLGRGRRHARPVRRPPLDLLVPEPRDEDHFGLRPVAESEEKKGLRPVHVEIEVPPPPPPGPGASAPPKQ